MLWLMNLMFRTFYKRMFFLNLNVALKSDGIMFRSTSGSDMEGSDLSDFVAKKDDDTILTIEVKKKTVLPIGNESSVEFFQKNSKAKCTMSQAFCYMIENSLLYGIISSYDHNWFLQRGGNNHNQILVSETLSFNNNNPTMLKAYAYIVLRAKQGHYLPNPNIVSVPNTTSEPRYFTRLVKRNQNQQ